MFTTVAFSESIDEAGVFANLTAVPDQSIKTEGDNIYIGDYNRLFGGMACLGTLAEECRLISPSLRRTNPYYITPLELDIHPGVIVHHMVNPNVSIPLDPNEPLQVESDANPAAPEQHSVVVWLADRELSVVRGAIYTINFEITLALVAGAWAFAEIDLVDELEIGNFAVVGARFDIDAAVCGRFVPVGAGNRPGAPCHADQESEGAKLFRQGNLGEWFRFSSILPPGVEILGSAAVGSATYQCYMDVLKL